MISRFPLMFIALLGLWLALNGTLELAHVILGAADLTVAEGLSAFHHLELCGTR